MQLVFLQIFEAVCAHRLEVFVKFLRDRRWATHPTPSRFCREGTTTVLDIWRPTLSFSRGVLAALCVRVA